jgi:hypothetical protein
MWLPSDRYDCLVSFITGCDVATGGILLEGFDSWIASQVSGGKESPLHWSAVVARRHPAMLDGSCSFADMNAEINEEVVNDLFNLLEAFLRELSHRNRPIPGRVGRL